jgi:Lon protease-like protein
MNPIGSDNALPENFDGTVKLFPLPNLVLFPGVIQALHLFEPRYRKLIEDALDSDKLITMALPKPDTDNDLQLSPELCSTVCIGKIITHHQLDDGRYNLLLMGVQRARIVEELGSDEPYRLARVDLLKDNCQASPAQIELARTQLVELFRSQAQHSTSHDSELLSNLINPDLPFGMLVDLICFSTGADAQFLYQMLDTQDVWARHEKLIQLISELKQQDADSKRPLFPPDFSNN